MSKRNAAIFFSFLLVPVLMQARVEGHFDRTLQVSGAVKFGCVNRLRRYRGENRRREPGGCSWPGDYEKLVWR